VVRAVELAQAGEIDAICTAPLNKEAMQAAGHMFPGHTELLGHLTGRKDFAMVLITPNLRVAHIFTHVGLKKALELARHLLRYARLPRTPHRYVLHMPELRWSGSWQR
jgi:4-phospho-D-threonate 3-dehydrogenase / 4-phospho-D-erythronate 3-dehydrogenase